MRYLSCEKCKSAPCAGNAKPGPSPLKGLTVVVLGAGGAGRALAFGAAERGARVIVCNRQAQHGTALQTGCYLRLASRVWNNLHAPST